MEFVVKRLLSPFLKDLPTTGKKVQAQINKFLFHCDKKKEEEKHFTLLEVNLNGFL